MNAWLQGCAVCTAWMMVVVPLLLPGSPLASEPSGSPDDAGQNAEQRARSGFVPDPDEDHDRDWHLEVGVLAGFSPEYEGADGYDFKVSPEFKLRYKKLLFVNNLNTAGVNLYRDRAFKTGAVVKLRGGRDEDDVGVQGVDEVGSSVEVGGFLQWERGQWRYEFEARQDVGGGHGGALIEMTAGTKFPRERPLCKVKFLLSIASDDYMDSFFGVTKAEAARTGLKPYNPDGGIKDVGLSLRTGYEWGAHWSVGLLFEYRRLLFDAADSPFVDDLGSPNQFRFGPGLSYTF